MKTINDFRKLFFSIIKEGDEIKRMKGSFEASSASAHKIAYAVSSEYRHIAYECNALVHDETLKMIKKQQEENIEKDRKIEKIIDKAINQMQEIIGLCSDLNCKSCMKNKQKNEEAEQAKNGFTQKYRDIQDREL